MTRISIIVAKASNNAIGKNNLLLWHLPADLKHFRQITTGHTIIMGRKTYDSIGKPLPNRRNIIITRQAMQLPGCEVVSSLEAALALCQSEAEVYVIGGAQIYREALPITDVLYLTEVHQDFEADTFFPETKPEEWQETGRQEHAADEKNPHPYAFVTLKRR